MTVLRRALVASSIVWALLLPLAPFAASQPAPARCLVRAGLRRVRRGERRVPSAARAIVCPVVGAVAGLRAVRRDLSRGCRCRDLRDVRLPGWPAGNSAASADRVTSRPVDPRGRRVADAHDARLRVDHGRHAVQRDPRHWPARRSAPRSSSSLSGRCARPQQAAPRDWGGPYQVRRNVN